MYRSVQLMLQCYNYEDIIHPNQPLQWSTMCSYQKYKFVQFKFVIYVLVNELFCFSADT